MTNNEQLISTILQNIVDNHEKNLYLYSQIVDEDMDNSKIEDELAEVMALSGRLFDKSYRLRQCLL